MTRTFHHKFSIGSKLILIIFGLLAIYFFWNKDVIIGSMLIILTVLVMERVLHSEYVFQDDQLVVSRGRFSKTRIVRLAQVRSYRPVTSAMGLRHYVLIEYGPRQYVVVEPAQEESFLKHLHTTIQELDVKDETKRPPLEPQDKH